MIDEIERINANNQFFVIIKNFVLLVQLFFYCITVYNFILFVINYFSRKKTYYKDVREGDYKRQRDREGSRPLRSVPN